MLKLFLVLGIFLCFLLQPAGAASFEEHIIVYYSELTERLQEHGFKGPIANEVAKFALIRQIHEDGQERNHNISINGMSPGGRNKEVIQEVVPPTIKLRIVTDAEGQQTYALYGEKANIISGIAIAKLFHNYINELSICNQKEVLIWNQSVEDSLTISSKETNKEIIDRFNNNYDGRFKILSKANNCYGPEGGALNREIKRLESLFKLKSREE